MAEPTKKSEAIEGVISAVLGQDRRTAIHEDKCQPPPIGCGLPVGEFKDPISAKEYRISGLCQKCQDRLFSGFDPTTRRYRPGEEGL